MRYMQPIAGETRDQFVARFCADPGMRGEYPMPVQCQVMATQIYQHWERDKTPNRFAGAQYPYPRGK